MRFFNGLSLFFISFILACSTASQENATEDSTATTYDPALIDFSPYADNPIFGGTDSTHWDERIRERGYILKEGDTYHMWYTGYQEGAEKKMQLGYASSADGLRWTRHPDNPVYADAWVEDMMVIKEDSLYHMFAEGENDIAHRLTSTDGIHWEEQGKLDIRYTNGEALSPGPFGTPTAWLEDGSWYLFYERRDQGIWLATSEDLEVWTHVQDEPVLAMGPESYDQYGLALNQIVKKDGLYYAYYHGTGYEDWRLWSTNLATSEDLIHWKKYENNPIMEDNKSSGLLVHDGQQYRLYTMHPEVHVHFPKEQP